MTSRGEAGTMGFGSDLPAGPVGRGAGAPHPLLRAGIAALVFVLPGLGWAQEAAKPGTPRPPTPEERIRDLEALANSQA
ncbi:MAG TPA: hypothetical protein VEN81_11005, partial [Planctomycetota bacterium]|nr:hypothetical protein [Planctomycetota bacterium]